jgi:hypothetical protein
MNIEHNQNYINLLRMSERAVRAEQRLNAGNDVYAAGVLSGILNNSSKQNNNSYKLQEIEAELRKVYSEYKRLEPFSIKIRKLGKQKLMNHFRNDYENKEERDKKFKEFWDKLSYSTSLLNKLVKLQSDYVDVYTKIHLKGQKSLFNNSNKTKTNKVRGYNNLMMGYQNQLNQISSNRRLNPNTIDSYIKSLEADAVIQQIKNIRKRKNNINKPINTDPEPLSNSEDPLPPPSPPPPARRGFFSRLKGAFTRKRSSI